MASYTSGCESYDIQKARSIIQNDFKTELMKNQKQFFVDDEDTDGITELKLQ